MCCASHPRGSRRAQCMIPPARLLNVRAYLVICFVLFSLTLLSSNTSTNRGDELITQEALHAAAKDPRYAEVFRRSSRLPNTTKYLLLWTAADYAPFYYLDGGQRAFIDSNCTAYNCYVTADRNFFGGDITNFHAIAFNGRNIDKFRRSQLPSRRAAHQKYIYFNMESADNYPVCNSIYDNFFNWTSTYRLDSELPFTYIKIVDNAGRTVGPKRDMRWKSDIPLGRAEASMGDRLRNKSRIAAWFVSHCVSRSGRAEFVSKLQSELARYHHTVDVYGSCGPLKCPLEDRNKCNNLLEEKYMFYLSLENSFAEDYVTEKLLTALQHNVVPVVYGGADYSRFLPPKSYLDGRSLSPRALATAMVELAKSPRQYLEYFKWKSEYTYYDPSMRESVCSVCEALNNKEMFEKATVYAKFREWWNPNYAKRCNNA